MVRQSRYGFGFTPETIDAAESSGVSVHIFDPTRGFHGGAAAQSLAPGFSPHLYNWLPNDGFLWPRSGLSQYEGGSASGLSGAALGAWRFDDIESNEFLVAASDRTIVVRDPFVANWSQLSYVRPSGWATDESPSGSSVNYWDGVSLFDAPSTENIGVLTNGLNIPMVFQVRESVTTYSNLTDFLSLASSAKAVAVFDHRLLWWNITADGVNYPTRLMWSPRGLPHNYQIADGAGAEDLLDMKGSGTRVIAENDGILLFTDEEVWRGRRRGDAYVFDFYPVERLFGCPYPRTIQKTPAGVVFLGKDLELYVVRGEAVEPLDRIEGASRTRLFLNGEVTEPERMWALYDPQYRRYQLFYTAADSTEGYPTRGLYYDFYVDGFFPQRFKRELTSGVAFRDDDDPLVWEDMNELWEDVNELWLNMAAPGSGIGVCTFGEDGTAYRFQSTQTNDDGDSFEALWTSHGLSRADVMRYDRLNNLHFEYSSNVTSNVSIEFAPDYSFTGGQSFGLLLPPGDHKRAHAPAQVTGFVPFFRMSVNDGSRIGIARFQARVVDGGI